MIADVLVRQEWTPMSSVLKKADKLNLSLSLSLVRQEEPGHQQPSWWWRLVRNDVFMEYSLVMHDSSEAWGNGSDIDFYPWFYWYVTCKAESDLM